jgi:hypothetical protein
MMLHGRSATLPGAETVAPGRLPGRRLLQHYLLDLLVCIGLVLVFGWIFQSSVSDASLHNALTTQNEVYIAISRFTPYNLFTSYIGTIDRMVSSVWYGYNSAEGFHAIMQHALGAVVALLLDLVIAVPRTLIALYQDTNGTASIVVLAGFGLAIGTVFFTLLATETTTWRLLSATAISPIAISVLFLMLQTFMLMMLSAFFWLTALAPYAVACPVICTLYWLAFPNAERGAVASLASALIRYAES